MTVVIDIIEGARVVKSKGSITEIARVAIVQLDSPDYANGKNILLALRDASLPQSGDPHPATDFLETEGLVLEEFNVTMAQSSAIARVEMVYKNPAGQLQPPPGFNTLVSGSVTLEETETQLDVNGNQVTVSYNSVEQGGFIRVLVPRRTLYFQRVEQSSNPGNIAATYVGKTNNATWNAGSAGTWMCDQIEFELQDGSTSPYPSWTFSYNFRYKDEGFDPSLVYIDPETGQPPPDLVANTGYKTIEYYTQVNFDTLDL